MIGAATRVRWALPLLIPIAVQLNLHAQIPFGDSGLDSNSDPLNKGIVLLDQVGDAVQAEPANSVRDRLFLDIPGSSSPDIAAEPVDNGISFGAFLSDYYFILRRVSTEDIAATELRLSALDRTKLYGCFDRKRQFSQKIEKACRYVRSADLQNGRFESTLEQVRYSPLSESEQALIDRLRNLTDAERKQVSLLDSSKSRSLHMVSGTVDADGHTVWGSDHFPELAYRFEQRPGNLIRFPVEWYLQLRDERLLRIWLDCSVRVGPGQLPIAMPDNFCRPVALKTDRALYLSVQKKDYVNGAGGFGVRFTGRVFDISRTLDPPTARELLGTALIGYLTENLARKPISANLNTQSSLPPREYLFARDFQWSYVLNTGFKGPYFERSAYLVQWWASDPMSSPYDADASRGTTSVFLSVQHSLQIGKMQGGDYPDASKDQEAEYTRLVQQAVQDAIARTVKRFHGQLVNSVGVFAGEMK